MPTEMAEERAVTKRIDVAKALKLRVQGNTYEEIAAVFGVTKSAVHQALNKLEHLLDGVQQGEVTAYSEERRNILSIAEARLLRSMLDEDAIQKAPLASRTMAFGVLYDKRRLEEGKSTENVSVLGKLILSAEDNLGNTKGKASASDPETK
jgi:transposase